MYLALYAFQRATMFLLDAVDINAKKRNVDKIGRIFFLVLLESDKGN